MKWTRYTAFAIGFLFGSVFLFFNLSGPLHRVPGFWETLLLLTGPVTLLVASVVGLWFEELAGWWLLLGGAVTAVLFLAQSSRHAHVERLVTTVAIFCLPMLCSGLLWLAHAKQDHEDGSHLPWMT